MAMPFFGITTSSIYVKLLKNIWNYLMQKTIAIVED